MATAFVQARMSSKRLPGKVLLEVEGIPLLAYTFRRLKKARTLQSICLVTTDESEDAPLEELARQEGVDCFRGSLEDVLDRFYQAALQFSVQEIVRITGDCPLVDPQLIDQVVECFQTQQLDYAHTGQRYSEGVDTEVIRFSALERSWKEAKKGYQREHCTAFINENRQLFRCETIENSRDDSAYRFTVDEPEDFEVVQFLISQLGADATTEQCIRLLQEHPEVFQRNRHIIRNEGLLISKANSEREEEI